MVPFSDFLLANYLNKSIRQRFQIYCFPFILLLIKRLNFSLVIYLRNIYRKKYSFIWQKEKTWQWHSGIIYCWTSISRVNSKKRVCDTILLFSARDFSSWDKLFGAHKLIKQPSVPTHKLIIHGWPAYFSFPAFYLVFLSLWLVYSEITK